MNAEAIRERFAADGIEVVRVVHVSRRGVPSSTYMKRPDDLAAYVESRFEAGDRTLGIESLAEGRPLLAGISRNSSGKRTWWSES